MFKYLRNYLCVDHFAACAEFPTQWVLLVAQPLSNLVVEYLCVSRKNNIHIFVFTLVLPLKFQVFYTMINV